MIELLPQPLAPTSTRNTHAEEGILPIQLVIYFDEAHTLLRPFHKYEAQNRTTWYAVMLSCLEDMRAAALPIFSIFLSTTPRLRQLAPPATSARVTNPEAFTQAPITELPFDCFHKLPKVENFQSLSSVEFLTSFGRPLYVVHSVTSVFVDIGLIKQVVDHGPGCESKR